MFDGSFHHIDDGCFHHLAQSFLGTLLFGDIHSLLPPTSINIFPSFIHPPLVFFHTFIFLHTQRVASPFHF